MAGRAKSTYLYHTENWLTSMPTSHIFVVENGVSKKVSNLSRRYRHYKKLLSTAIPFMSSAQDTAVTADTADTATAGCAYARASLSDADDFSDQDNDSLLERNCRGQKFLVVPIPT